MEIYYKPNNRGGARVTIDDAMSEDAAATQRAVAAAQGLLPVANVAPRPKPTPFGIWHERILPVTDEYGGVTGYSQSWEFRPVPVRLDQGRLMADEAVAPVLDRFAKALADNQPLAAWWAGECVYLRGSEKASLLLEALGMDEAAFEAVALRCRR